MEPFVGEVRMFPWSWPPEGWALCNGATMLVSQNQALFALLGTTYGGTQGVNFKLPDLRGRTPVHFGKAPDGETYDMGHSGGTETVTLDEKTMPPHIHMMRGTTKTGDYAGPKNTLPATVGAVGAGSTVNVYALASGHDLKLQPLAATALSLEGGGGRHNNMQPSLVLNFCIATAGSFPPRQ